MNKNNFKLTGYTLVLLTLLIFTTSCQDKVQIKLDEKGKVLCVDAFLNNLRQNPKIRLTYTDSYFSGKTPPALVGANITVKDLTANKTYTFIDNSDGNYTYNLALTDTIIFSNHTYQLDVKYNSYEYKSITNCIQAATVDSLYFEYKEANTSAGNNAKAGNRLRLIAADIIGPSSNFYWVKIFKNGKFYGRPENIQLEFFGNNGEFDGQLFFEEKWATSGPDGDVDPCITGDVARLEIHGISREAYDFFQLGIQMSNNGGLFAGTPVNLPTNISRADKSYPKVVGMFSVSDVKYGEKISP
jgi:hypothetical protein